jgi:DNA-binding transcriptional LysR family regulator
VYQFLTALLYQFTTARDILGAGEWLMSRDIAAGRLVHVLPDWLLDAQAGVFLVRPSARFSPAATNAFKEWIESKFADGPPWRVRLR